MGGCGLYQLTKFLTEALVRVVESELQLSSQKQTLGKIRIMRNVAFVKQVDSEKVKEEKNVYIVEPECDQF